MSFCIDLLHQVALVTGGVQGIGLAIAQKLAAANAHVAICDILPANDEKVRTAISSLNAMGTGTVSYFSHDLSQECECNNMVDDVICALGQLDVLVLNAALVGKNGNWDVAFNVNVKGVYYACQRAKPYLEQTKGRVVVMTSASVYTGGTGIPEYIATKGGTSAMIRFVAREFAPLGIRVNGVAPAVIMTDMTLARFGSAEEMLENYKGKLPLNRIGTVDDVANSVLFLASFMSDWMCGETLLLDGGRLYLN